MTNKEGIEPGRRSFLAALLSAGSVAVGALLSVPLLRFTLHPVLVRTTEKSWSDVGILDEFQKLDSPVKKLVTIEQRDGWRKTVIEKPVYVSKDSAGRLIVLSAVCTHPGCAIPWMEKGPEIRLPLPSGHVFAG
jgi:Rieske Fe-S protein